MNQPFQRAADVPEPNEIVAAIGHVERNFGCTEIVVREARTHEALFSVPLIELPGPVVPRRRSSARKGGNVASEVVFFVTAFAFSWAMWLPFQFQCQ